MENEFKRNASGYLDPTAYESLENLYEEERVTKLVHTIFHVCELAGFAVEGRITLRNKKTGRIWK